MNREKLDPKLLTALSDYGASQYLVFIEAPTPLQQGEAETLCRIVGSGVRLEGRLLTTPIGAKEVDALSELPWVRSLSLSRLVR